MRDGSRRQHACVRGWATNEHLASKLLEHLEEASPEHSYHMATCDQWGRELRLVRELLERGVKDGGHLIPRNPSMVELRLELAEKCCPACDVPALVMCARRLELLEEPGNGGTGCARGTEGTDPS
jgi:transposase